MTTSLSRAFPGVASLSTAGLGDLPTPLVDVQAAWEKGDDARSYPVGQLLVKRDDLTSQVYGGNKVRKLDFLLGEVLERGSRAVITFGAYGSNHALATAVHASAMGLEPHVVLSPQEPGPYAPRTLLAHASVGSHLHVVEGWDGSRKGVEVRRALTQRDGVEPYVIPMGGTNPMGTVGYVDAAFELAEQVGEAGLPDVVYVPAGTLGTAVGLAVGFAALGAPTRVEAVRVTPDEISSERVAVELAADTASLLHRLDARFPKLTLSDLAFEMRHDLFEPGYGVVTEEGLAAVKRAKSLGISLETTYTGKAFSAMLQDAEKGMLREARVLFWDTYNSAPYPTAGPLEALPAALRAYIAQCEREFGPLPQ